MSAALARWLAVALAAGTVASCGKPDADRRTVDLLITDANVIDGTGAAPRKAHVVIHGDRVTALLTPGTARPKAKRTIAAAGRVVSPGFIDMHAHGDVANDNFVNFLAMGVTTVAIGQDGVSAQDESSLPEGAADLHDAFSLWLGKVENRRTQLNLVPLSGHGSLRAQAGIDDSVGRPGAAQIARMRDILAADLAAGSFGLSFGLEYIPGRYAEPGELRALTQVVAQADGLVLSHLRSEDDGLIAGAIDELVDTSSGARVHVSHLKVLYGKGAGTGRALLRFMRAKRAAGTRLSADIYPYTAGYTGILLLFPEWALPPSDYDKVVATRRDELLAHLRARMIRRGGPDALLIGSKPYAGKTLAQVAAEAGKPFEEVLLALGPDGADGAHFIMNEALQQVLLASLLTAISTDGSPDLRHPRGSGTYARLVETFVRERKALSLPQAIHKATGLPASLLQLRDRGVVRIGAYADLLLFDPAKIHAEATYANPLAPAKGFDLVLVNGRIAFEAGALRPGRHGVVLRRARPAAIPGPSSIPVVAADPSSGTPPLPAAAANTRQSRTRVTNNHTSLPRHSNEKRGST